MQEYEEIRRNLEKKGYRVADNQFYKIVTLAKIKAIISGKGERYIGLLLPDVVKDYFFREAINASTI